MTLLYVLLGGGLWLAVGTVVALAVGAVIALGDRQAPPVRRSETAEPVGKFGNVEP